MSCYTVLYIYTYYLYYILLLILHYTTLDYITFTLLYIQDGSGASESSENQQPPLNIGHQLPRLSLTYILKNIQQQYSYNILTYTYTSYITKYDPKWHTFKYIYYTEGDQILYMRNMNNLYNTIDKMKNAALIPHRMQVYMSLGF